MEYLENQEVVYGIQEAGIWSKVHKLVKACGGEVEDHFQEIVAQAIEVVADDPTLLDQEPGYLLQRAMWEAQKHYRQINHTYMKQAHNYQTLSMDRESGTGSTLHQMLSDTPNLDDAIDRAWLADRVRSEAQRFEQGVEMVDLLSQGWSYAEIAETLDISKGTISYRVRKIREAIAG
jgi:DNA-binding NarL/FixJ family response regulator